jgi:hypothetical protein
MGTNPEVKKLAALIGNPESRRALAVADDPMQAASDAGIDVGALPEGVWTTLSKLSHDELEVVSRVRQSLDQAGVPKEFQAEIF